MEIERYVSNKWKKKKILFETAMRERCAFGTPNEQSQRELVYTLLFIVILGECFSVQKQSTQKHHQRSKLPNLTSSNEHIQIPTTCPENKIKITTVQRKQDPKDEQRNTEEQHPSTSEISFEGYPPCSEKHPIHIVSARSSSHSSI